MDCENDLGIWLSSTLRPSVQCQKAYSKAMQSLVTIKQSFKYITRDSFNILYKTYIRPHIEYCIQAWSPYYAKDIDLLEKIQHRALQNWYPTCLIYPTKNGFGFLTFIPFTAEDNVVTLLRLLKF